MVVIQLFVNPLKVDSWILLWIHWSYTILKVKKTCCLRFCTGLLVSSVYSAQLLSNFSKQEFGAGVYTVNDTTSFLQPFWSLVHTTGFFSDMTLTTKTGGLYGPFVNPSGAYTSLWLYNEVQ